MRGHFRRNYTRALASLCLPLFSSALVSLAPLRGQTSPPFTTIDYPGATSTFAWTVNNHGDVGGLYVSPDGTHHGFVWSGGHISSLDFPGARNTEIFGINDAGDLAGDYYETSGVTHGFVLSKGRFVTVDVPRAGATALAGINIHGMMISEYNVASNDSLPHTAIIEGGLIRKYDYPGATYTQGNGLNDAGDIVGNYNIAGATHGFVLSNGKATVIDFPSASFTGTYGISNSGDLAGRYTLNGVTHGYVYSGGGFTTIDFPGATSTGVDAINSVGDVVGRYTLNGFVHAFVINSYAPSYLVTDLGVLPGGTFSQAAQGNTDNGLIAGVSGTPGGSQHVVLWQYGQITDLAATGLGGPNSSAVGLNDWGVVVGGAETADKDKEDFCAFGSGFRCVPFAWQNGVMSRLPTLGGPNGVVNTINNAGWINGIVQTAATDTSCVEPIAHQYQGVIWGPAPGQMRVLRPLPGDTVSIPLWMNDLGQSVGTSGLCSNSLVVPPIVGPHAVLWDFDGTPLDLGNLGGSVDVSLPAVGNRGLYISNRGEVVGGSALAGNKTAHAFLWTRDAGMKDLGMLNGDSNSGALAINDRGEVVGVSNDDKGNFRAFLWRNGLMTDLNTLAPSDSPLYLLFALGINNRGEIVGYGATKSGDVHAFLAMPSNIPYGSVPFGVERLPDGVRESAMRNLTSRTGHHVR
jgi:probable HAF family extracellular repeat protein